MPPPNVISRVSNYLFSWGTPPVQTQQITTTSVTATTTDTTSPKTSPTSGSNSGVPAPVKRSHFGQPTSILCSQYVQGSVLLLLYEFVHSNSFFLDFVFYDHHDQGKSSGTIELFFFAHFLANFGQFLEFVARIACPEAGNTELTELHTKLSLITLKIFLEKDKTQHFIHDPSFLVDLDIYRDVCPSSSES